MVHAGIARASRDVELREGVDDGRRRRRSDETRRRRYRNGLRFRLGRVARFRLGRVKMLIAIITARIVGRVVITCLPLVTPRQRLVELAFDRFHAFDQRLQQSFDSS